MSSSDTYFCNPPGIIATLPGHGVCIRRRVTDIPQTTKGFPTFGGAGPPLYSPAGVGPALPTRERRGTQVGQ